MRSAAEALGIESKSLLLEVARTGRNSAERIELLERIADEGLRRADLREEARDRRRRRGSGSRRKVPVFTFKDPEKTFSVSVKFRKSTVDRGDLITALEQILDELRAESDG